MTHVKRIEWLKEKKVALTAVNGKGVVHCDGNSHADYRSSKARNKSTHYFISASSCVPTSTCVCDREFESVVCSFSIPLTTTEKLICIETTPKMDGTHF